MRRRRRLFLRALEEVKGEKTFMFFIGVTTLASAINRRKNETWKLGSDKCNKSRESFTYYNYNKVQV